MQLDAQNPAEFRGDEAKASQGIEGLLDAGFHVTITAAAAGTLARLKRAINTTGIANFDVIRSQAIDGFVDKAVKIALLTERDLTGRTSAVAVAKTPKRRRKAIDLVELKKGDYVVHEQHGIGRFIEMRQRTIGTGADVFADLVELVDGDEQFVRRGAALGRRIFDDQVFASGLLAPVPMVR